MYFIDKITLADGTAWHDKSVPASLGYELFERPVAIFRIAADAALPPTTSVVEFQASCAQYGCTTDATYIVVLRENNAFAYFISGTQKRSVNL